ncbi:MAG: glycoside hydrolase family 3 N-terminal domain-containing protein [Planctomycetota bacterium]
MSTPRRARRRHLRPGLAVLVLGLVPAVLRAQDDDAAARRLAAMDRAQKAGQLFVSWIRADADADERRRIAGLVRDVGLGGVILSLGDAAQAARVVDELQAAAAVPLLCAGDFEGGVAFRFDGATDMGNQMLVGASRLSRLAQAMGEVTGREARALGVPWVLAPVLDVNSNPQNPIINVRSFGEDPELVARLGSAFAQGVRSAGAMPCGKHFPGHGDVNTDSHLDLPTVPGSPEVLRARELLPFRRASARGLESVMTGHLAVPGLHTADDGEAPETPATLSRRILQDVLRGDLGFGGLVVTDALDMGGVKGALPPAEVAVRALAAGADVLLMPPDPAAARDAIVAAVERGDVAEQRLDDAVRRILQQKERLGLLKPVPQGAMNDWGAMVATPAARAVADEIARRGLTLVRDPRGLVPLERAPWLVVELSDRTQLGGGRPNGVGAVAKALGQADVPVAEVLQLDGSSDEAAVAAAAARIAAAERVLLALHVRVRSYSGTLGLPPNLQPARAALRPEQAVVAVSFGSPYLAQQLPADAAFVCAYASSPATAQAAARGLAGVAPVTGRLPVTLPDLAAAGTGLTLLPGRELPAGAPADEGLPEGLAAQVRAALDEAVADRITPGAVCLVLRHGRVVLDVAAGRHSYEGDAPAVTRATPYDLASLTKVCATLPAVLSLVAAGELRLEDPVQRWVPAFAGDGKDRVTVQHLLAHTSGLPPYVRLYETLAGKDAIVTAAAAVPLQKAPGAAVVYSDLGMMLARAVVDACSGEPFADYVRRAVWAPLGMQGASFAGEDAPVTAAPPTEVDGRGAVQGRVHDENAFAMGGISGHAGMFATADDVLRLGACFLARGRGLWPPDLVAGALRPQDAVGSDRGLGFDLLQPGGFGGGDVLPDTFGHTGFTGTSILCDPRRDLCVVLLTNRVHPTRDNPRILDLRRRVHDLVLGACE